MKTTQISLHAGVPNVGGPNAGVPSFSIASNILGTISAADNLEAETGAILPQVNSYIGKSRNY